MADAAAETDVPEDEIEEEDEEEDDEPISFKPHAMFPRDDDGPETRDIVWIQLLRMLPDGTVQTCPDQFQATDLPNWGEVYRRFGGGKYRAKGRNAKMQWQAESPGGSDWVVFDGASKPFAVNPVEMPAASAPAAPVAPPPPPPAPPAPSGPTVAEALLALSNVIATVATAVVNRPAPPPPPAPDNTLAVAMMNNMAAQQQANAKSTADVLVALLSKDNKPDNSSLVAVLNANAETTRAQAAAQNTLLTAVLTQKQPGLTDLAEVLAKLGRGAPQPTNGIKDTIETIKAVREISGQPQAAGGGSELGEVTSLVTSLAALDKGGSKEKDKDEPPKPRRNRILMRTAMGLVEVVDPSPELLRQLAAPAQGPALGPAPAAASAPAPVAPAPVAHAPVSPTATRSASSPTPPTQPPIGTVPSADAAPAVPTSVAPVMPTSPPPAAHAAPLSDEEELVQIAAKLRSDPSKSIRLAELLRDAPAAPVEAVAAPTPTPEPPTHDRRARSRRRSTAGVAVTQEAAPTHDGAAARAGAPTEGVSGAPEPEAVPAPPLHDGEPQGAVDAPPPVVTAPGGGARTIIVGGVEATVVEAGEAPADPIRLPQSFEPPPPDVTPQISDEVMARLTSMKADEIETLVRKRIGAKADGIAEAIRALPREALPFALKMFPPDALRALAAGTM